MRVLLDTTALYVAAGRSDIDFTPKVRRLLEDAATERVISAVSILEVAIKANKGLSDVTHADMERLIDDLQLTVLPLTLGHALRLFGLPGHHADPFDRMLIATALVEDLSVVTNDRCFRQYRGIRVIW